MKLKYIFSVIALLSIAPSSAMVMNHTMLRIGAIGAMSIASARSWQLGAYHRQSAHESEKLHAETMRSSNYSKQHGKPSEHWSRYCDHAVRANYYNIAALGTTIAAAYMLIREIIHN